MARPKHLENAAKAIELLNETKKTVIDLLKATPDLQLFAKNKIENIIGRLSHATGRVISTEAVQVAKRQPLTSVFGQPIGPGVDKPLLSISDAEPEEDEVTDYQYLVQHAFEEFLSIDAAELKLRYTDLVIRGVAQKAGLEVTITEPETITTAFIESIKEAILFAEDRDAQVLAAAQAADKVLAEAKEETEEQPEIPAPTITEPETITTAPVQPQPATPTPTTGKKTNKPKINGNQL